MASGCSSSLSSTWFVKGTADTSVIYTGPAIPALSICTNDTLAEVEAIILQQIINFSAGNGITIPDIDLTTCDLFTDYIVCCNGCDSLDCLMKIVFESLCTLYTDYTTLSILVSNLLNGPYNTGCLTLGSNPTLSQIIQELILEFCALKAQVAALSITVASITGTLSTTIGNFLLSAITTCSTGAITKTGSGATASIAFTGFVPVGGSISYEGALTYFDSSGLGMVNTPMCGWALENGNNGTRDKRGRVAVTAINGMGGGTLNAAVNQPGALYSVGDTGGVVKYALAAAEIPVLTVTGNLSDPGHNHGIQYQHQERKISTGGSDNYVDFSGAMTGTTPWTEGYTGIVHSATPFIADAGGVLNNTTGVTLDSAAAGGPGNAHENRMPYIATYSIKRIA